MPSTYEQPSPSEALGAFLTFSNQYSVTPLYPGLGMPEQGQPRDLWQTTFDGGPLRRVISHAPRNEDWYALEIAHEVYRHSPHGGRLLVHRATVNLYVGDVFTVADIEAMADDTRPNILLDNMVVNDWPRVVRTRVGNWQPLRPDDAVITVEQLAELVPA